MSGGAKVGSVDALKVFRAALIKFAEIGNVAMGAAESDVDRTLGWLERDQTVYWAGQLRKRHAEVTQCEDALRQKKLFKGPDGSSQSVVDEMKALAVAKRRKEEAQEKNVAVQKAIQVLRKESVMYKGRVQKLATVLQSDVPKAVFRLDGMLTHLEEYLAIETPGSGLPVGEVASSIAKAEPSRRIGPDRLRDQTPVEDQRKAAAVRSPAADDSLFAAWEAGALQTWQREALGKLAIERVVVDPEQKVVVLRNAWQQPRIYIERKEPAFEGDSGWFLGPVEIPVDMPIEYDALRAGDLIAAQPDLAELFSLPAGFLVVLDSAGPTTMLDAAGLDAWAVALMTLPSASNT
jgi:hypothetical protein